MSERVDSNCGRCGKTALSCYVGQGCCKQCDHAEYWRGLGDPETLLGEGLSEAAINRTTGP